MRLKPEHNDDFLSVWRNPVRVFLALHAKCIYAAVLPWDFFFSCNLPTYLRKMLTFQTLLSCFHGYCAFTSC